MSDLRKQLDYPICFCIQTVPISPLVQSQENFTVQMGEIEREKRPIVLELGK